MFVTHAPAPHIGEGAPGEAVVYFGEHAFQLSDLLLAMGILLAWSVGALLFALAVSGTFVSSMDPCVVHSVRRLHRTVKRQHAVRARRST